VHRATRKGHLGALMRLLAAKCDPSQTFACFTPLHIAARKGYASIVTELATAGGISLVMRPIKNNASAARHHVALCLSAERGHLAVSHYLAHLMVTAPPYEVNIEQLTGTLSAALFGAAVGGFSDCVIDLLSVIRSSVATMIKDVLQWTMKQEERPFEKLSILLVACWYCDARCIRALEAAIEWKTAVYVDAICDLAKRDKSSLDGVPKRRKSVMSDGNDQGGGGNAGWDETKTEANANNSTNVKSHETQDKNGDEEDFINCALIMVEKLPRRKYLEKVLEKVSEERIVNAISARLKQELIASP